MQKCHWWVSPAVVLWPYMTIGMRFDSSQKCILSLAWAYRWPTWSLHHMSWPAVKSTVLTVESVKEPGCDGGGIRDVINVTQMCLSVLAVPMSPSSQ